MRSILTGTAVAVVVTVGGSLPGAGATAVLSDAMGSGAQVTSTSTTLAVSDPAISPPLRSSTGTTRTVTRALIGIAAATAVMSAAYFWYTIPSRRERLAERRE